MKTKLIIANWLFSLLLLTYNGDSLILTLITAAYFCFSCVLLNRNDEAVEKEVERINRKIMMLASNLKPKRET